MADPAAFIASWLTPSSLFIFVNLVIGTIALTSHFTAPKKQTHQHPQLHRSPSLLDRVRSFNLRHYNHHHDEPESESEYTQPQLVRTPSSLLERVRSFNLRHYNHHHDEPESEHTQPQLVRTPSSLLERVRSFNLSLYKPEPAHAETEYAQPGSEEPKHEEPQLARSPSLLQRVRSRLYRSDSVHQEREDPDPVGDSGDHSGEKKGRAEMKKSASGREGSGKREWEGEDEGAVERRRPATTTARSETTGDEEVDAKADDFINMFKKQLRLQRIDSILRYRGN